jgi:hypothetical protein
MANGWWDNLSNAGKAITSIAGAVSAIAAAMGAVQVCGSPTDSPEPPKVVSAIDTGTAVVNTGTAVVNTGTPVLNTAPVKPTPTLPPPDPPPPTTQSSTEFWVQIGANNTLHDYDGSLQIEFARKQRALGYNACVFDSPEKRFYTAIGPFSRTDVPANLQNWNTHVEPEGKKYSKGEIKTRDKYGKQIFP